jgi:SET domain-containing protein
MSAKKNGVRKQQDLTKQLIKLWERGQSVYCDVRGSEIHGRGVYATRFIPKGKRIIEYVGEVIAKKESDRRGIAQHEKSQKTGEAAVYIFTLSKNYDIDGNVPWNTARLINHSCEPNCEAYVEGRKIFIYSTRDIQDGEELGFDYGFDVDCYEDHPCLCGSKECIGYIVSREQWPELKQRLEDGGGE